MLVVHHLNNSRSQRVLWLLEELGVPYEVVRYPRDPKTMLAPPALEKIHPLGKSPVVTDGELTIAESGAILEYIVDTYGNGRLSTKPGTPEHLRCRYFMHYAEGSLMPFLVMKLVCARVRETKVPFFIKPITRKVANGIDQGYVAPNLTRHLAFLDGELAARPWFAGDQLTVADIQMSYPMEAIVARVPEATPRMKAYVEKIEAMPAYQRAAERGGPSAMPK